MNGTAHVSGAAQLDTTLGIGMAARNSYKLDVSGNAEITNMLTVGNSIGINCNVPQYTIDISGNAHATGQLVLDGNAIASPNNGLPIALTNGNQNMIQYNAGSGVTWYAGTAANNAGWQGAGVAGTSFAIGKGPTTSLLLTTDGKLGINCNIPLYPLDVAGSNIGQTSIVGYGYTTSGLEASTDPSLNNISIHSKAAVWSEVAFIAASDERIKKNIVDATSCLSVISSIKLRSFDYKEPSNRTHVNHGVIAQEIQAVYPGAVHTHSDVVPSILQETTIVTKHKDGSLLLVLPSAHGLAVNDSVSLTLKPDVDASGALLLGADGKATFAGDNFETRVLKVDSATTFTVDAWPRYATDPARTVMVVGKRVNDFLSVDKDVLGLLALGGVQELVSSFTSLTHRFSTLLGLNPGLTMPAE